MFTTCWDERDFKSQINSNFSFTFITEDEVKKTGRANRYV